MRISVSRLKWKVSTICSCLLDLKVLEAASTPDIMCFWRIPKDPQLEVLRLGQFFTVSRMNYISLAGRCRSKGLYFIVFYCIIY